MKALRESLRRMTGVGADQYAIHEHTYWSDDDLDGVLAERVSARLLQERVRPVSTVEGGQGVVRHGAVRVAGTLDVESAELVDRATGEAIAATIHGDGRVEYEANQAGVYVVLTATAYDLSAAAADVLEAWASAVVDGYDVTIDGQKLSRSQRFDHLTKQAARFRSSATPSTVKMVRSDVRHRGRVGHA